MRHPSEGTLRRLVDEPAAVADADREHVAECPQCLAELATAHEDAAAARAALGTGPAAVPDVDAAWARFTATSAAAPAAAAAARAGTGAAGARRPAPTGGRRRSALRSPVVAALGVATILTAGSAAAAGDWLQIFRTEQVAQVRVSEADLVALPDLTAYGDVEIVEEADIQKVADAATAATRTGLPVPEVAALPRGVTGRPAYHVISQVTGEFTFSAAKARKAAAAAGKSLPAPPPGLDGSTFRLEAGPGHASVWSQARGVPALVVGRALAPKAYSSDVAFDTARDYLLSLPGIPDDLASQLRSFSGDGTTLPLPLPAEHVRSSTTQVDGARATVFSSRDGILAGVVWVRDGVLNVVAGSLSEDEVLDVARHLRTAR